MLRYQFRLIDLVSGGCYPFQIEFKTKPTNETLEEAAIRRANNEPHGFMHWRLEKSRYNPR